MAVGNPHYDAGQETAEKAEGQGNLLQKTLDVVLEGRQGKLDKDFRGTAGVNALLAASAAMQVGNAAGKEGKEMSEEGGGGKAVCEGQQGEEGERRRAGRKGYGGKAVDSEAGPTQYFLRVLPLSENKFGAIKKVSADYGVLDYIEIRCADINAVKIIKILRNRLGKVHASELLSTWKPQYDLSFEDGESIDSDGFFFKISKGSGAVENLLETSTDASILLHFDSFDPIGKIFCADAGSAGMCVNVYVSIRKKKARHTHLDIPNLSS